MITSSPHQLEALAVLDGLPDAAMSMLVWWRDEHGDLVRPCTRDEIRSGLLDGTIDPASVIDGARLTAITSGDIADTTARYRRRQLKVLRAGGAA